MSNSKLIAIELLIQLKGVNKIKTDSAKFYEDFYSETEALLAEAENLLIGVDLKCVDDSNLDLRRDDGYLIKADSVMRTYMRMTEVTHILESVLNKIKKI